MMSWRTLAAHSRSTRLNNLPRTRQGSRGGRYIEGWLFIEWLVRQVPVAWQPTDSVGAGFPNSDPPVSHVQPASASLMLCCAIVFAGASLVCGCVWLCVCHSVCGCVCVSVCWCIAERSLRRLCQMRCLIERVLFEPGLRPVEQDSLTVTPRVDNESHGTLLMDHIASAPASVVEPFVALAEQVCGALVHELPFHACDERPEHQVVALCTGSYRNAFVHIAMDLARLLYHVESFLVAAHELGSATHPEASAAGAERSYGAVCSRNLDFIASALDRLRSFAMGPMRACFVHHVHGAEAAGDTAAAVALHAHLMLLLAHIPIPSASSGASDAAGSDIVNGLLVSGAFVTAWHSSVQPAEPPEWLQRYRDTVSKQSLGELSPAEAEELEELRTRPTAERKEFFALGGMSPSVPLHDVFAVLQVGLRARLAVVRCAVRGKAHHTRRSCPRRTVARRWWRGHRPWCHRRWTPC